MVDGQRAYYEWTMREDGVHEPLGVEEPAVGARRQLMITFERRDLDRCEHGKGGEEGGGVET